MLQQPANLAVGKGNFFGVQIFQIVDVTSIKFRALRSQVFDRQSWLQISLVLVGAREFFVMLIGVVRVEIMK